VLFSTSSCFDLSVFEMFVTLSIGGNVLLPATLWNCPTWPARRK